MEATSQNAALAAVVLGGVVLYSGLGFLRKSRLPPGPTPLPIIGNAHQMPTGNPWLAFSEMGKKYGE